MYGDYYPVGAYADPRAPYNEPDNSEFEDKVRDTLEEEVNDREECFTDWLYNTYLENHKAKVLVAYIDVDDEEQDRNKLVDYFYERDKYFEEWLEKEFVADNFDAVLDEYIYDNFDTRLETMARDYADYQEGLACEAAEAAREMAREDV